jgi:hypothetical protein
LPHTANFPQEAKTAGKALPLAAKNISQLIVNIKHVLMAQLLLYQVCNSTGNAEAGHQHGDQLFKCTGHTRTGAGAA